MVCPSWGCGLQPGSFLPARPSLPRASPDLRGDVLRPTGNHPAPLRPPGQCRPTGDHLPRGPWAAAGARPPARRLPCLLSSKRPQHFEEVVASPSALVSSGLGGSPATSFLGENSPATSRRCVSSLGSLTLRLEWGGRCAVTGRAARTATAQGTCPYVRLLRPKPETLPPRSALTRRLLPGAQPFRKVPPAGRAASSPVTVQARSVATERSCV